MSKAKHILVGVLSILFAISFVAWEENRVITVDVQLVPGDWDVMIQLDREKLNSVPGESFGLPLKKSFLDSEVDIKNRQSRIEHTDGVIFGNFKLYNNRVYFVVEEQYVPVSGNPPYSVWREKQQQEQAMLKKKKRRLKEQT